MRNGEQLNDTRIIRPSGEQLNDAHGTSITRPSGEQLNDAHGTEDMDGSCLFVDIEAAPDDGPVSALGAVLGGREMLRDGLKPGRRTDMAFWELNGFALGAERLVGHNIVDFDLPILRRYLPDAGLVRLPVIDTLYLSPLAAPEHPYHRLVKGYKLVESGRNDPVGDCLLARELLRDCRELLRDRAAANPGLLDVYRSCFEGGTGMFLEEIGGRTLQREELLLRWLELAGKRVCRASAVVSLPEVLDRTEQRPAVAYVLAWMTALPDEHGRSDSVLPRWVHHKFSEASRLIHKVRRVRCGSLGCGYCSVAHDPERLLHRYFGFPQFRGRPTTPSGDSLQEVITTAVLADEPVLAIMPTGGGKSLCFQLPAIASNEQIGGLTVVVSPLQALMRDQVDNINENTATPGLAAALNGLQTMIERQDTLDGVRLGKYALLYVSPEQLRNTSFRDAIRQREVTRWVFDEAHCVAQWGHDFRPDYLYAARFIKEFSEEWAFVGSGGSGEAERRGEDRDPLSGRLTAGTAPVACFTATAKRDVQDQICGHFKKTLGQELRVIAGDRIDRDNLHYTVEELPEARKIQRVHSLLREHVGEPGSARRMGAAIVYAATRRRTEEVAGQLRERGWAACHFHGGMDPPDKTRVQDDFLRGGIPVIVADERLRHGSRQTGRTVGRAFQYSRFAGELPAGSRQRRAATGDPPRAFFCTARVISAGSSACWGRSRLAKRDLAQILRAIRMNRRRRDQDEVVVSPGDLIRTPDTDVSFDTDSRDTSTQVKVAISWLEQAEFLLRDENRTRLFRYAPEVTDDNEVESIMNRLQLPGHVRPAMARHPRSAPPFGPDTPGRHRHRSATGLLPGTSGTTPA